MSDETQIQYVGPADFFTGFFAALAAKTPAEVYRCDGNFDQAIAAAFNKFVATSRSSNFEVTFSIRPDPIYGTSAVVQEGVAGALRRSLISFFNPTFQRFKLLPSPTEAQSILRFTPGGPALYEQLAEDFLTQYRNLSTAA